MPVPPKAFGVDAHGFKLGTPLSEAMVAEFEKRHEVTLPPAYRLFVTELGNGGAGPGYGLSRLNTSCCTHRRSGHLAQASPYLPGPRYRDDWEQRYEARRTRIGSSCGVRWRSPVMAVLSLLGWS